MLEIVLEDLSKNISVNDILIDFITNPISDEEFSDIEKYYENLRKAGFIDLIHNSHYYNKSTYDFYFTIGDASKNWYRKLILKSSIVDLVLKYKIINFVVHKYHEHN
jgi:hypothetical protein